jgi:5-methylcytosine-specific restriction protein A
MQYKRCNPICVLCEAQGRVSPTTVTDHIEPINQGGSVYEWDNLQALCDACHASKSGREAHDKGRGGSKT